jgi:hypothetical protein
VSEAPCGLRNSRKIAQQRYCSKLADRSSQEFAGKEVQHFNKWMCIAITQWVRYHVATSNKLCSLFACKFVQQQPDQKLQVIGCWRLECRLPQNYTAGYMASLVYH